MSSRKSCNEKTLSLLGLLTEIQILTPRKKFITEVHECSQNIEVAKVWELYLTHKGTNKGTSDE